MGDKVLNILLDVILAIVILLIMMYFDVVLLILLLIGIIFYCVCVYEQSYQGKKKLIEKQIKKYKKEIQKRKDLINYMTKVKERLDSYDIKPTRIITSQSTKETFYYDGNKKILAQLGNKDIIISAKELLNFELIENKQSLYKYTLGTYFTGQLKSDSKIEELKIVVYLKRSNNPVIKINCIGVVYDFNKDDEYYYGKEYAEQLMACLIDMKEGNDSKENILKLVPEELDENHIKKLENDIKYLKKEPFSKFIVKYYKNRWKELSKKKWFVTTLIIIGIILGIILINKIVTLCKYNNNLDFYNKIYTMGKSETANNFYIKFNKDGFEYAVKDENNLYYHYKYNCNYNLYEDEGYEKKYKCDVNDSYGITLYVYKRSTRIEVYASLYYSELKDHNFVLSNIDSFDKLRIQNDTTCKNKGIFCNKSINNDMSGLYVSSGLLDNEKEIINKTYSVIYINTNKNTGYISTFQYDFDHVTDVIEDLDYESYKDTGLYDKYIEGTLEINNNDITISDGLKNVELHFDNGTITINDTNKINGKYSKYSNVN